MKKYVKYVDDKYREKRFEDFKERKKYAESYKMLVKGREQEYINVHPMSDELEMLEKFGIKADDCKTVHCYWNIGNEIIFLEVESTKNSTNAFLQPGLYARWSISVIPMFVFFASVEEDRIPKYLVENIITYSYNLLVDNNLFFHSLITDKLFFLGKLQF